jgi:integrase
MRRAAACEARWQDFDPERRVLHVPSPKGGAAERFDLPLSNFFSNCSNEGAERTRPCTLIVSGCSRRVVKALTQQRPNSAAYRSSHVLRHSFVTHARAAGVSKSDVGLLLNHASGDVTDGYIHEQGLLVRLLELLQRITDFLMLHMSKPGILSQLNEKE